MRIKLRLPGTGSLKDKRQVVKSITARIASRFNVAVAEVDDNDSWQLATIGISCIGNDKRKINEVLSRVMNFVNESRFEIEILNYEMEFILLFGD